MPIHRQGVPVRRRASGSAPPRRPVNANSPRAARGLVPNLAAPGLAYATELAAIAAGRRVEGPPVRTAARRPASARRRSRLKATQGRGRRSATAAACWSSPGSTNAITMSAVWRWPREHVLEASDDWRDWSGWLPASCDWSRTHARRRGGATYGPPNVAGLNRGGPCRGRRARDAKAGSRSSRRIGCARRTATRRRP